MELRDIIREALNEDIGPGDRTTEACVPEGAWGTATIRAKQPVVVCGHTAAHLVFSELAGRVRARSIYEVRVPDAQMARNGEVVAQIEGPMRILLTGERVALNLLMKLSGIATNTRTYVEAAGPDGPKVVDTRKTTPLLRDLEKAAVRAGGGFNHRHGLFDGILVKDNHIAAAGGVAEAVKRARAGAHHLVKVEVEVMELYELDQALEAGADAILLDNMDDTRLREAVERARKSRPRILLEASGNMTPERIRAIRGFGLDLISAGGLVHQARWADLSMDVQPAPSPVG
jgi:nicotinate-nucleotide pyrophosphorylase (carboxylating)